VAGYTRKRRENGRWHQGIRGEEVSTCKGDFGELHLPQLEGTEEKKRKKKGGEANEGSETSHPCSVSYLQPLKNIYILACFSHRQQHPFSALVDRTQQKEKKKEKKEDKQDGGSLSWFYNSLLGYCERNQKPEQQSKKERKGRAFWYQPISSSSCVQSLTATIFNLQ